MQADATHQFKHCNYRTDCNGYWQYGRLCKQQNGKHNQNQNDSRYNIRERFVDSENNIVQNTLFNYDEYGRLVSEVRANDVIIYNYENNELIGFTLNGTPYFYLKDI